jgi:hypothetical protein
MTVACSVSGAYSVNFTDCYGVASTGFTTHTWFSGASLTDQTGAADVTGAQAIVYTATGSSIVPNGNFVLGNLQGWLVNKMTYGTDSFGVRMYGPGNSGAYAFSPAFQVVPGAKYRMNYTVYNGSGSGGIYLRIAWQSAQTTSNVFPASNNYYDFAANVSVGNSPNYDDYDWVAPAGALFASMCVYAVGASDLAVQSLACIPYAATGQWGADVTGNNTSNDTSNVDGVPSTTIASVVPAGYKLYINSGARQYDFVAV